MKHVNVVNNIVVEILPPNVFALIGDPEFLASCREAPDEVEQHWIYDPATDTYWEPGDMPEPVSEFTGMRTMMLASLGVEVEPQKLAAAQAAIVEASGFELEVPSKDDWRAGEWVTAGVKRIRDGETYVCLKAHSTQDNWVPERTLGILWDTDTEGEGTVECPIPFVLGMGVKRDSYYSHEAKIYQWTDADHPSCGWPPGSPGVWQWKEVISVE